MTAVVGILNRQAIAIAADSAVTVNGKATNRALKIFTISKYHPVGVMLYNLASFMGTPWETIFKLYRKQLGDTSFPTVKDYQEDFIKYLHGKKFFSSDEHQLMWFRGTYMGIVDTICSNNPKDFGNKTPNTPEKIQELIAKRNKEIDDYPYKDNSPDFADFTIEMFNEIAPDAINNICENLQVKYSMQITPEVREQFRTLAFRLIKSKDYYFDSSGVVFVGFGEDEIFPSLVPIRISFGFSGRLRYFTEDNRAVTISNEKLSDIVPFAQTDTMMTLLTGISPELETKYVDNFKTFFADYNKNIIQAIGDTNPQVVATIEAMNNDMVSEHYKGLLAAERYSTYIRPLFDAVDTLSKEDLAEMAESLIYLTYLQKRITLALEDVGGHVDVAVISKGDGFIWIKRKHYFNQELNRHFMSNYFK